MAVDNPSCLLHHTSLSLAEDDALKFPASGGVALTIKPAMQDAVSVQQRSEKVSPCPRCQSLDTKFCYFNNHNVKQPRHFCRKCQRYWTAGGALRNVPVGAGRRKHKAPLISKTSKFLYPEENDIVDAESLCYPSNKTTHFSNPTCGDGSPPHSFQCVAAMATHVDADARYEGDLGSLRHKTGDFNGVQNPTRQAQLRGKSSSTDTSSGSCDEEVGTQIPLLSSSPLPSHRHIDVEKTPAATFLATDKTMGIAQPSVWLEQLANVNPSATSKSMQEAYVYGNSSLAWSNPLFWPCLMPYAMNVGSLHSNMDQAALSAAWACAVTATAANILQTSPLWNPYGWGRDVNKSERVSSLGKRGCSSLHEQEPLRVPKTLKIGDPDEVMHSSILMTLGLSSLSASSPASVADFFSTGLERKPDDLQHKPMVELPQHQHRELQQAHVNPAAQARSVAFQESC